MYNINSMFEQSMMVEGEVTLEYPVYVLRSSLPWIRILTIYEL